MPYPREIETSRLNESLDQPPNLPLELQLDQNVFFVKDGPRGLASSSRRLTHESAAPLVVQASAKVEKGKQESLDKLVDFAVELSTKIVDNGKPKVAFVHDAVDTIVQLHETGKIDDWQAANAITKFRETVFAKSRPTRVDASRQRVFNQDLAPVYLADFIQVLPQKVFDKAGAIIFNAIKNGKSGYLASSISSQHPELSKDAVQALITCFVEGGFVDVQKNGYKLTGAAKKENSLGYWQLRTIVEAAKVMAVPSLSIAPIRETEDTYNFYEQFYANNQIDRIRTETDHDSVKTLYLSDILLGNKNTDVRFLGKLIDFIKTLPKDKKPDVIVVSGLLQGGFQYLQKNMQQSLAYPLDSVNKQFEAAKAQLDDLKKIGAKIVYGVSTEDLMISENYNGEAIRMLRESGKSIADKDKRFITYWQFDQLKQSKLWNMHLRFQRDVVFPYCLRSGRRLLSADEIEKKTGGKVRLEEYVILYEAYAALMQGREISEEFRKVLGEDINNIPIPGKEFDFSINNGVNITSATRSGEYTTWFRHNFKFSAVPLYGDPNTDAEKAMAQLAAQGKRTPFATVQAHQKLLQVSQFGGAWVVTTPGMQSQRIEDEPESSAAVQDGINRGIHTRKIIPNPGALMLEAKDDYSTSFHLFNKILLDKAASLPKRAHVAAFSDWQVGSITSRPDMIVSFLDEVTKYLAKGEPVYMAFNGDIIQGRNYPNMPNENQGMMLISIDNQTSFVYQLLGEFFKGLPKEQLRHVAQVAITRGNHEINSGYDKFGSGHSQELLRFFDHLFEGTSTKVALHDKFATKYGDLVPSDMAILDVGAYKIFVQHQIVKGAGQKGDGGSPIYQAERLIEGAPDLLSNVDGFLSGHHHHPALAMFGDKFTAQNYSIAGLSLFEWGLGYKPAIGGTVIHLGGNLPVEVQFLGQKALANHTIANPRFSEKGLAARGYKTDEGFDPIKHGFIMRNGPQSALDKAIWNIIEQQTYGYQSKLG